MPAQPGRDLSGHQPISKSGDSPGGYSPGQRPYLCRTSRGQSSLYYIGNEAKKMSHPKIRDDASMSHPKIRDDASMSHPKILDNSTTQNKSSTYKKGPTCPPEERSKILNTSGDVSGRGIVKGETSWPEEKNAAAKFEKIVGRKPDKKFQARDWQIVSDNLDLLDYKLQRGVEINDPVAWLWEAIRSNYIGQKKIRGFKTAREKANEAEQKRMAFIEQKQQDVELEADRKWKENTRKIIEQFNSEMRLKLHTETVRIIEESGRKLDPQSQIGRKIVSGTAFFIAHDYLLTGGQRYQLIDVELRNYLEAFKLQFHTDKFT